MILLTGAAGFLGFHVAQALLDAGHSIVGLDNLNGYYSKKLKTDRLAQLSASSKFRFVEADLAEAGAFDAVGDASEFELVVHFAAQAGVRASLEHPFDYARSNLTGHLAVLEFCRHAQNRPPLIYASSSSVYGCARPGPVAETDAVDAPESLYAATKRADELMSDAYAKLYGLKQIGLRHFTVYGAWGRPDMAYWIFTEKILGGHAIELFNKGALKRDFTHVEDVVRGVLAMVAGSWDIDGACAHRIYNLGANKPTELTRFVDVLEQAAGRRAQRILAPMQPGDVFETFADIRAAKTDYGYNPQVRLEDGLAQFVDWFRRYHN
ncbi:MAG: NAD-dependent epimerase/dehydratase family protein [Maricaulaceae bacterium]